MQWKNLSLKRARFALASMAVSPVAVLAGDQGGTAGVTPAGTAFTYQGQLNQGGVPVNSTCDFEFSLWDAAIGPTQVGSTLSVNSVTVIDGLLTAHLDFGAAAFNGKARWLQIALRCPAGAGVFTTLSPRQPLTPTPIALTLPGLWTQQNATSPNLIGGYRGNSVTAGVKGATIGGGGQSGFTNRVTDDYGTIAGGRGNQAGDNAGTTTNAQFATVGGGLINTATEVYATVGGGYDNTASDSFATVGGGDSNSASGSRATVAGGYNNAASADHASVGGGYLNFASGYRSTVAGGVRNIASGGMSTVAGGEYITAGGSYATVGGGYQNTASGLVATVPGGSYNFAVGDYSFAAGYKAKADHQGAFVWADSTVSEFASTANDQFLVRATGGVHLNVDTSGGGLRIEPDAISPNLIGGYSGNSVMTGVVGATIGGGGTGTLTNGVTQNYGTVGGGLDNNANHEFTTVGGGVANLASGYAATVPGGFDNAATAQYSFAAGMRATANNPGAFVWADSTGADLQSTANNQFMVRASGGTRIYSNSGATVGVRLAAGGNSWSAISDRALKEKFTHVNAREILQKLSLIPITFWNLKSQDQSIQHIGPMAQDFHAAFGIGEDEEFITTTDADGVALAAIQGLYEIVQERDQEISDLKTRLAALESLVRQFISQSDGGAP